MRIQFKLKGTEKLQRALRKYSDDIAKRALPAALFQEAEEIITAAKRLTPVLTGALRSSGHVALPVYEGSKVRVEFGFGGPAGSGNAGGTNNEDVGYAIKVHEDLQSFHRIGQAKYLEEPFRAAQRGMIPRLIRRIKENAKNVGTP